MPTPEEMAQTMIDNMPEKTGKSLPEWLKIVGKQPLEKHGQIVSFLKKDHGVTHGFANLIAHSHLSKGAEPAADDLVGAQYKGPKADLKPIYDAVIAMVGKFGKDVEIAPKKTYVSLRRKKQFALIQPSTRDRVDIGINLKGEPAKGRLEKSGSFNAMVSHRVKLGSKSDVNAELKGWLKKAYDAA
jgi:predicted transport protein